MDMVPSFINNIIDSNTRNNNWLFVTKKNTFHVRRSFSTAILYVFTFLFFYFIGLKPKTEGFIKLNKICLKEPKLVMKPVLSGTKAGDIHHAVVLSWKVSFPRK